MKKELEKTEKLSLNLKQEAFAQLFTSLDKDFFGNGVQSYIEVYQPDITKKGWYKVACARASQLLSNVKVSSRITELLDNKGFNNENVDKQHLFLINQYADLKTKLGAIREYNQLKKRIDSRDGDLTIIVKHQIPRPKHIDAEIIK